MKYINHKLTVLCLLLMCYSIKLKSQTNTSIQAKPVFFEGIIVGGYVDHGAFINCTGPAIKFSKKPLQLLLGLLPGLRIKEDKVQLGIPKNSTLTPSLGFGLTAAYKHIALQLPFYYNSKTSTKNGKWNPGIGCGYKF